jgi:hypothetical protein
LPGGEYRGASVELGSPGTNFRVAELASLAEAPTEFVTITSVSNVVPLLVLGEGDAICGLFAALSKISELSG